MSRSFLFWVARTVLSLMILGIGTAVIPMMAATDGAVAVVPDGTHLLVRLDRELRTNKDKVDRKFDARTLEPLGISAGFVLAPGTRIRGHVSRIERGGLTRRAGLWLTFDEIDTRHGRLPIVAEVSGVPGDFSVRQGESQEGEIEARTRKTAQELEAAAGAALGAASGASAHGGTGAAIGGAVGGLAGFRASPRVGEDVDLSKGTKLDLVLDRPLYLPQ